MRSYGLDVPRLAVCAVMLSAVAVACLDSTSDAVSADTPEDAARGTFLLWSASRGVQVRDISVGTLAVQDDRADVQLEAVMRASSSESWQDIAVTVPVRRDDSSGWQMSPTSVVARLVQAANAATEVADASATSQPDPTRQIEPTPIAQASPTPNEIPIPPPPEGTVVYQSDWTGGMDGWIGTPDWQTVDGQLVNDGTRSSRDPWIEAPVQIDPWQPMIVEFQAEAPPADFGSFGLVARASDAGWYQFGIRWENLEGGTGTPVVTLGASIRQETRLVEEEMFAERRQLASGPHQFRAEFGDGSARFFVDGEEVGAIPEGSFYPGEFVGLWSELTTLKVSFFRVTLV